jgi:hypothetical protein
MPMDEWLFSIGSARATLHNTTFFDTRKDSLVDADTCAMQDKSVLRREPTIRSQPTTIRSASIHTDPVVHMIDTPPVVPIAPVAQKPKGDWFFRTFLCGMV